VFGHGLTSHVEVFAQLAERLPVAPVKLIEQLAAASVGQGFEHCIHHAREYATKWLHVKAHFPTEGKLLGLRLWLRAVIADEIYALLYVGNRIVPIVLVFDGDVAGKALGLQFIQNFLYLADTGAERHGMAVHTNNVLVNKVATDDAAFEQLDGFQRIKPGANPVAGVGAGADAAVAVFHDGKDIFGVPHFVAGITVAPLVLVNADVDVEFLDQLFNDVQLINGLGGDTVKIELFGEFENLAPLRFVAPADHAIVDSEDAGFGQLVFKHRYKLLQQIGEGGCGVVYMADQEEPVKRRVALKVIKPGMDTKEVLGRFEAERQALALMDHPNIAKVLDAGATETGRPFFVMELVRGIPITRYCDENKLNTEQRLELFIQVCQAIQHAHQKGIIHRDIKPSNILVADHDGVPMPKIIDFGIAKATAGQTLTDKTVFTALEQFIGTPAYMSPEQAKMSGLDIDTRSDIYSLGVLLYELLTGKTPFDAKRLFEAGWMKSAASSAKKNRRVHPRS
jgi:tRNA A-37 threonylcarbamoyl transferase component Bud32